RRGRGPSGWTESPALLAGRAASAGGGHHMVEKVRVDRVVDARAAPGTVRGVFGALEGEQPGAGDARDHRARSLVRGRRVTCGPDHEDGRRAGDPHVTQLVAAGRPRHARATGHRPGAPPWGELRLEPRHV